MKITLTKDIGKERAAARKQVDALFAARTEAALGPKAALYAVKYSAAIAHMAGVPSPLIADSAAAEEIINRNKEMQAKLSVIERERQALQAKIDQAATAADIESVVSNHASNGLYGSHPLITNGEQK